MNNVLILAGATGLIGSKLLENAQNNKDVHQIHLLVRRQYPVSGKVMSQIVDFENIRLSPQPYEKTVAVCCLGTTIEKAGSKEEFFKVDHDYPIKFAKAASDAGIQHFVVISSIGANPEAKNFYLSVKGKMEEDLKQLSFQSIHIIRPSLLLGNRQEYRKRESFAQKTLKPLSFLIPYKYKPIDVEIVANKIISIFNNPTKGIAIYEGKKIWEN